MTALERRLNNESFKPIEKKLKALGIPEEHIEVFRYHKYKDKAQLPEQLKSGNTGLDKVLLNNMTEELVLLLGRAFCKEHSFYEEGIGIITF